MIKRSGNLNQIFTNSSNTRSFPDASSRNQAVADAAPTNKKDEIETPSVLPKEKKDTFLPYRKDGSLDYDGKHTTCF